MMGIRAIQLVMPSSSRLPGVSMSQSVIDNTNRLQSEFRLRAEWLLGPC